MGEISNYGVIEGACESPVFRATVSRIFDPSFKDRKIDTIPHIRIFFLYYVNISRYKSLDIFSNYIN